MCFISHKRLYPSPKKFKGHSSAIEEKIKGNELSIEKIPEKAEHFKKHMR